MGEERGHICSAFVRGYAHKLRPINAGIADDLDVIADRFDAIVKENGRLKIEVGDLKRGRPAMTYEDYVAGKLADEFAVCVRPLSSST
jgi:hypothetical protein